MRVGVAGVTLTLKQEVESVTAALRREALQRSELLQDAPLVLGVLISGQ